MIHRNLEKTLLVSGLAVLAALQMSCGRQGAAPQPDATPPSVQSESPANLSVNVSTNTSIAVTFSEAMMSSSISPSTFQVRDDRGAVVAGDRTLTNGTSAMFVPKTPLNYSTTYIVTVTTGIKDAAGNAMAAPHTFVFTTGAHLDTTPPYVAAVNPDGMTPAGINAIIGVTFSETMDMSTVTPLSFVVRDEVQNIPGLVSSLDGKAFIFTASTGTLNYSTNYSVTIDGSVRDLAGNHLADDAGNYLPYYAWSFRTQDPAADVTPPFLLSTIPSANANNVSKSITAIIASFSENMLASSITPTTFFLMSQQTGTIAAGVVVSGAVAVLTPLSPLQYDTSYVVTLASGTGWVTDLAGNQLADAVGNHLAAYTWSFETEKIPTCLLTVTKAGTGHGGVTASPGTLFWNGNTGTASYDLDTVVTLTHNESNDSTFSGWSGACSGIGDCAVTMTDARNVTSTFSLIQITVSTDPGTGGTITPASRVVSYGSTTTFTITPNTGYSIGSVTGCDGTLSGNTYTTGAITGACTVAATFTQSPINGACGSSNGGTFTTAPTTNLCSAGNATAVNGLGPWTWNCTGLYGGTTANCSANIQTYTVTPSVTGGHGSISPNSQQRVDFNGVASFTLTPDAGYHVAAMGGTCGGTLTGNAYTTSPVTANCTVIASFTINTYTITASTDANGSINPSGLVTVNYNVSQKFTTAPNANYHINDVLVDGESVGAVTSYTFTHVKDDHTIAASFALNTFTVTPSVSGGNGSISPNTRQTVDYGSTVSFTVSPSAGYYAVMSGTCGGTLSGNTYTTASITVNCTVVASFTAASP